MKSQRTPTTLQRICILPNWQLLRQKVPGQTQVASRFPSNTHSGAHLLRNYDVISVSVCRGEGGKRDDAHRNSRISVLYQNVSGKASLRQKETEVQTREGEGGGGSVAVSLLHITVSMLKASLFSKESQNVSSVKRDGHIQQEEINHVQDRYILKHQFGWHGMILILLYEGALHWMLRDQN